VSFLESYARWAADLRYDDLPESVRHKTRLQVGNLAAAAYAGFLYGGESLTVPLRDQLGSGGCSVLGGSTADAVQATFLHSTWSMMHDYDDYLFMAHSGHGGVFAGLAVGEQEHCSGREYLTAVAAANELAGRLGASVLLGPHNGQMWSFVHQAASAAVTARLLDGGAETLRNAVALALYNPPFPNLRGFMKGDSKYVTAGVPSATGVRAGLLAAGGARGAPRALTGSDGFLEDFSYQPLTVMLGGLGESWVTESLSYKPYPGCAYLQAPLQAFDELRAEERFRPGEVEQIRVGGSLPTVLMENYSGQASGSDPITPTSVAFSVKQALALHLTRDEYETVDLSARNLESKQNQIREYAGMVTLEHDWDRTLDLMEGISRGVDLGALISEVGYLKLANALRKVRRRHSGFSTAREAWKFLTGTEWTGIREMSEESPEWEDFDLGRARMDRIRFRFGCRLEVRLSGGAYRRRILDRHRGSAGETVDELESVVHEKLRREARTYFSSYGDIDDLVENLRGLGHQSVRPFAEAFVGESE
jgi:2-methylcitrate dehydratase PrpD